jgi:Mrp family chromosome partitioning ATPase
MPSPQEKFRQLRLRVQKDVEVPAFVVVGSAARHDGATYVACGLAQAFAEAGYNTLLLDANARNPGIANELGLVAQSAAKPERIDRNLSLASLFEQEERTVPDAVLGELVAGVRWRYAVTIADVPPIPGSGPALQLANAADCVLIALRMGRRACEADEELKQLLEPGGVLGNKDFTGIVPTRAAVRHTTREPVALPAIPSLADVIGKRTARIRTTGR